MLENIRLGQISDLDALIHLESRCFEPERQDGRRPIRHSLVSRFQEIWIADKDGSVAASMTLRFHPKTCRIYSIAVAPEFQGQGVGKVLLDHAVNRAVKKGCLHLHLEVDARNKNLIEWYQRHGYKTVKRLKDYYAPGWHGLRLALNLPPSLP